MCAIAGIVSFKKKELSKKLYLAKVKKMADVMRHRGADAEGFFTAKNVFLGHRRLAIIDLQKGAQPMTRQFGKYKYTIVYDGEIFNTAEIRTELSQRGFVHQTKCDTETLLLGYICFGKKILDKLIGIFSFVIYDEKQKKIFMARDNFGVKPFYYSFSNGNFVFASEQKGILASGLVKPQIDKVGLQEMFSLCPLKTEGLTYFKNIFELKSGEMAELDESGFRKEIYYKIKAALHKDSFSKTIKKVKLLVEQAITSQLVGDVEVGAFLSGGLDSSIITAVAAKAAKRQKKKVSTFSLDFVDNEKFFKQNLFQPNADGEFVKIMSKRFDTLHTNILLKSGEKLVESLSSAVIARDAPGMGDIDSSLLRFCEEVKKSHSVVLSGECADEIFCGYPWFWKPALVEKNFFPFLQEKNEKWKILKKEFKKKIKPFSYAKKKYLQTLSETPLVPDENESEKRLRQIQFLTIKFFMQNLIERSGKMSASVGVEVRVPFCDKRIVDYVYNIPYEWKLRGGREKWLLRKAVKRTLPKSIVWRKKSPYPKTHDPQFYEAVVAELKERMSRKDSKLRTFIDKEKLNKLISSSPQTAEPFMGQLMARAQLFAQLIQIDEWFCLYKVEIVW